MFSHRLSRCRHRLPRLSDLSCALSAVADRPSSASDGVSCAPNFRRRSQPYYVTRQYSAAEVVRGNNFLSVSRSMDSSVGRDARRDDASSSTSRRHPRNERSQRRGGQRRPRHEPNELGHKYKQIGGPIDRNVCELADTEIHNLLAARNRCRRDRHYGKADRILQELERCGVYVNDTARVWRADGRCSAQGSNDMPRMVECQTIEEAIRGIHDNLGRMTHRALSAFWALSAIVDRTVEEIPKLGPKDLAATAVAFAKTVNALGDASGRRHIRGGGAYHDYLQGAVADRKGDLFQSFGNASMAILARFSPRHLSNLAYAHALADCVPRFDDGSTLFDHIAEKSIPLLGEMNEQELANLVWSFEKAGASHPRLFEMVADHIVALEDVGAFRPQAFANILQAYAKAGEVHLQLFEKIADHIAGLDSLGDFDPHALSMIVWAYAKADVMHPSLFGKVADHIASLEDLQTFEPQALSNTAYAYAKSGEMQPVLFEKIADHIVSLGKLEAFKPQNISNIVHAFAKAEVSHLTLFEKLGDHVAASRSLDDFKPQELANTVYAYAKAEMPHPHLFEKVANHIVALDNLDAFKPQEVSVTIWAFAKAAVSHPVLFEKIAEHIVALDSLEAFDPQELSNTLHAFAKADVPHPPLFAKVADCIVALGSLKSFKSHDLSSIVYAFAKAGESHPTFFEMAASHIVALRSLDDFTEQSISNLVWGFNKADVQNPELYEKLTDAAIERGDEFTARDIQNLLRWTE